MKYIYSFLYFAIQTVLRVCMVVSMTGSGFVLLYVLPYSGLPYFCRLNLSRFLIDSRIICRRIACMNVLAIFDITKYQREISYLSCHKLFSV